MPICRYLAYNLGLIYALRILVAWGEFDKVLSILVSANHKTHEF